MRRIYLLAIGLFTSLSYAQNKGKDTVDNTIYTSVEQSAECIGGMNYFYQYLFENANFTNEGRIIIEFIVETNGTINEVKVVKGIDALSDKEAQRLLKNSPMWKSAKQNGKKVRQKFQLPITVSK
jgi:periplasmic protein TonB